MSLPNLSATDVEAIVPNCKVIGMPTGGGCHRDDQPSGPDDRIRNFRFLADHSDLLTDFKTKTSGDPPAL